MIEYPLDETATLKVKARDIGYWSPGKELAIFFGPTPASIDETPAPASEVNIIGKILEDPAKFKNLKTSLTIKIISI